jgi:hypothetical protein
VLRRAPQLQVHRRREEAVQPGLGDALHLRQGADARRHARVRHGQAASQHGEELVVEGGVHVVVVALPRERACSPAEFRTIGPLKMQ